MKNNLLKEKEVCEYLKVSRTTLWRMKKEGMPNIKVGNSYRYKIDDVMNWVTKEEKIIYSSKNAEDQKLVEEKEEETQERIVNSYSIDLEYLWQHNLCYLSKIFSTRQLKTLKERLSKYKDLPFSNSRIVKIFTNEYNRLIKEDFQQQNRHPDFDNELNRFISKNDNSIKIIWGNCLDALKRMESESVQLMITSPPYFNAREYSQWGTIDNYLGDMRKIIRESYRVLDNHRVWVWNVGDIFDNDNKVTKSVWGKRRIPLGAYFTKIFEEEGFEFVDDFIWDKGEVESKRHMNGGIDYPFYQYPLNCYEHILIFHKHRLDTTKIPCPICGSLKVNGNTQSEIGVQSWECKNNKCFLRSPNNRGKRFSLRTNMMQYGHNNDPKNLIEKEITNKWRRDIVPFSPVIKINQNGQNIIGHTAPFPEDIPEMAIKYFSYTGEKILDPFAGIFTTPIVARKLHRIGIGIEINKSSFRNAIIKRIDSSSDIFYSNENLYTEYDL